MSNIMNEYDTWKDMHRRCNDINGPQYHNYGGRGIKICPEWFSFDNFLLDMGPRPKNYVIDRTDNHGPYNRDNCKWVTKKESGQNTRKRIKWHLFGKIYNSRADAAKALNVSDWLIIYWCKDSLTKDCYKEKYYV